MKIKTFSFEDNNIFKYNRKYENELFLRQYSGEYYYISNIEKIDNMINDFINSNGKNTKIVDIKINSIVKGNNPPTSILIYTLIYEEI